mgnify:CR=1 FL=1
MEREPPSRHGRCNTTPAQQQEAEVALKQDIFVRFEPRSGRLHHETSIEPGILRILG